MARATPAQKPCVRARKICIDDAPWFHYNEKHYNILQLEMN
jgi:hypothetical protein